jgi:uncharacterized SAM-binding protein YcdF (DUF218 family)
MDTTSAEVIPESPDLLIVLGKNIGVGSTKEDIQADKYHLSVESRFNTLAARAIYESGMTVLFSTGQTAGPEIPSEAGAMRDYFMSRYRKDLADPKDVKTEEISIDTAGNAKEVARWLQGNRQKYGKIKLLTVGYHAEAATTLFENYGVKIDETLVAEDILSSPRTPGHKAYEEYIDAWRKTDRIKKENKKEHARQLLLHIDRKGKLVRLITQRSRG